MTEITKIYPTPTVTISARVLSAMEAFTSFQPKSEKGMLFLGKVNGMRVTLEDFILYPQRGDEGGIDFDDKHKHAAKFWPSVHAYAKETGLVLVGWGHYWSGGVHHSHDDNWQDDVRNRHLHILFTNPRPELGFGTDLLSVPGSDRETPVANRRKGR